MYYSPTTEGVRVPPLAHRGSAPSSQYPRSIAMSTVDSNISNAQPSGTQGMSTRGEAMRPRGGCYEYENCECCCGDCGCSCDDCCDDSMWCGCC
ncbi:hypothetical protein M407DRAFT_183215 [Tulasnella calospora MUT 4182]|uniref:Uncharacterized protein n=1 Tax=Tulasnella calospora MUT 4182 TaxID=1051891 RepID=A0A0C3L4Z9_9AGAM|nr:hypothetical protein M407DRAFT_183215 [Tulasnella calospora MUT 4182]